MADRNLKIELNAVIVAMLDGEPHIRIDPHLALPSGPFETAHRTLEQGLRAWAKAKGGSPLGYVEQLYTFADRDRAVGKQRFVSIGYLALMRAALAEGRGLWSPWYRHFPWEDHRKGYAAVIPKVILPRLKQWKADAPNAAARLARAHRIEVAFPKDPKRWNEELVLQRYELLWEAGMAQEKSHKIPLLGVAMAYDHRRILATAMARLRAKIKYRPVVFELLPDSFTLLQLQQTVEALAGLRLHKQNFRRLIEGQGLVEETGAMTRGASGRPAKLVAFRREVLQERAAAGTKLPRTA